MQWLQTSGSLLGMSGGRDRIDEASARLIVERVTGARVLLFDVAGAPPRSVDARMEYADGRVGWMEVSSLGSEWEYRLLAQLAGAQGRWEKPGRWSWTITLSHPRELKRIRSIYRKVILACEHHGVATVDQLPADVIDNDADFEWLWAESTTRFFGVALPPDVSDTSTRVRVSPTSGVSNWGRGQGGLVVELNAELERAPLASHVEKLQTTVGDERHLFLHVTQDGVGEGAFYELIHFEIGLPESEPLSDPPSLPDGISHLWLFTGWGKRITRWTRGAGWDHPRHDGKSDQS